MAAWARLTPSAPSSPAHIAARGPSRDQALGQTPRCHTELCRPQPSVGQPALRSRSPGKEGAGLGGGAVGSRAVLLFPPSPLRRRAPHILLLLLLV